MAFTVDIDGSSITSLCQSIRWRPKLSSPAVCIVRVPSFLLSAAVGTSELHLYQSGTLVFSGPVWYVQSDGDPDSAYTEITAYDHTIYLRKRLCKTAAGDLITPGSVLLTEITAPAILAAYITNAINDTDAALSDPLPLSIGSVAGGGADVSGVPMSFPMDIEKMKNLLLSTGQLDMFVNPGVGSSSLDFTNGEGGSDLSGSVSYDYGTGLFNSQIATITLDMEVVINAIWYLLGPRLDEQHWRGSITPTAPHPGGFWPPALVARFLGSRSSNGYMQEIRIFDDNDDENSIRPLFEEEWANEAWIRAEERTFASIRPERGIEPNFAVGDLITVSAGSLLNGGFTGAQRIYSFEADIDTDGVCSLTEILTSADQEGA